MIGWISNWWSSLEPTTQLWTALAIAAVVIIIAFVLSNWAYNAQGTATTVALMILVAVVAGALLWVFINYSYATKWSWVATGLSIIS